jgi:hypothetical protein
MFARRVLGERRPGQPGDERRRALHIAIDPHGDLGKCGALATLESDSNRPPPDTSA